MTDETALDIRREWAFERIWRSRPRTHRWFETQSMKEYFEQDDSRQTDQPMLVDECHVLFDQVSSDPEWDRLLRKQLDELESDGDDS